MNRDTARDRCIYITNLGPSIVQSNLTLASRSEVKDARFGTGNGNEEIVPNLGGHAVPNSPGM